MVSSYGLLYRDIKFLQEIPWAGIILDEAQNVKNPETRQSRAARSLKADYRVALTGTPVENNVGDLWSIMEFLNPGFLGTQAEFKRNFFVPIQASGDTAAAERLNRHYRLLHPPAAQDGQINHRGSSRQTGNEGLLPFDH